MDEDVSAETVVAHSRLHRERYWREVCFCSIHANCPLFKLVLERFKLVNWFLIIVEREDVGIVKPVKFILITVFSCKIEFHFLQTCLAVNC